MKKSILPLSLYLYGLLPGAQEYRTCGNIGIINKKACLGVHDFENRMPCVDTTLLLLNNQKSKQL